MAFLEALLRQESFYKQSCNSSHLLQWYAFHKEPAGGIDAEGQRKSRLLDLFGHWSDNVVDLIKATPEADILRRDIYDRSGDGADLCYGPPSSSIIGRAAI